MKEYLIVDGYNIINAWQELKNIANDNLESARQKLIEIMMEHGAFKGINVIIVFDAYLVKGSREFIENHKNLKVIYTREHQTADSYIEKFISNLGKYDIIKVATNDWAEQQIILGKGASRVSARELKIEIDGAKDKIRKKFDEKKIQKNTLEHMLDEETLSKLQQIRRRR